MNSQTKIEHRDPAIIGGHIHPALKSIPALDEKSPEFLAIAAGVGRCGILQPILIDEQGRVLDDHSRTMIRCALRWQLKTVPVQVRASEEVHLLIIHSLAHRRHLSKSAIAYLAVPHLDQEFETSRARRLQNIAKNATNHDSPASGLSKTVDDLAEELGVGRSALFEARKVHQAFADKAIYQFNVTGGKRDGDVVECTLKEWFEPKILRPPIGGEHEQNRPLGLGGVIAGIASVKEGNKDKFSPKQNGQLELALGGFATMTSRMLKLPVGEMCKSIKNFYAQNADKFTDEQLEQLEQMGEAIKAQAKQLRKAQA